MGEKMAMKLVKNLHDSIKNVSIAKLISASSIVSGFSEKRISILLNEIPDLFQTVYTSEVLLAKITNIKGFSSKLAEQFLKSYAACFLFLTSMKAIGYKPQSVVSSFSPLTPPVSSPETDSEKKDLKSEKIVIDSKSFLRGKKIVFSGFRDENLERELIRKGMIVVTSMSKKTAILVVKSKDQKSTKIKKAEELNIKIFTLEELQNWIKLI
jgi:NAD-dependent DNA ligase